MTQARVKRIILLEARAERRTEATEADRWEAARLISEELESKTSQRDLATKIRKSHAHVGRMNWVWQNRGTPGCQTFNAAYQKAKAPKTKAPKTPPKPIAPENEAVGATEKPRKEAPRDRTPEESPSEPPDGTLPDLLTKPSADELASEAQHALKSIDPSRLTELGWKYLDRAQERLSELYEHLEEGNSRGAAR